MEKGNAEKKALDNVEGSARRDEELAESDNGRLFATRESGRSGTKQGVR